MIKRDMAQKLTHLVKQFPAVALLGPRQSGKTTLVKSLFKDYCYFNFEDPEFRLEVAKNPKKFLQDNKDEPGIILDEAQHIPQLFSYIQMHIDDTRKIGHFIITGSHNLLLNEAINQSLAGRVAFLTLLPLSINELRESEELKANWLETMLLKGSYPSLYGPYKPSIRDWYRSYIQSYIERDVRLIKNITDLNGFQKFMKLCATRVGTVLDLASLSKDACISVTEVKHWLSALEASYIIFLVHPYYRNIGKRVIKGPKIYFYDTGILCSLLSITTAGQLFDHTLKGNIFESYILADLFKQRFNYGFNADCYFWQSDNGEEIDCILQRGHELIPLEIKLADSVQPAFFKNFALWNTATQTSAQDNILIYGGNQDLTHSHARIISWQNSGLVALENMLFKDFFFGSKASLWD